MIDMIVKSQRDFQKRDEIIFGQAIDWESRKFPPGVCQRFEGLDASGIEKLLALGFMRLSQTMNASPTVESFLGFAKQMEKQGFTFKCEGFTFDLRFEGNQDVCLEGIYFQDDYPSEIGLAFAKFVSAYHPDELSIENKLLRAWWD